MSSSDSRAPPAASVDTPLPGSSAAASAAARRKIIGMQSRRHGGVIAPLDLPESIREYGQRREEYLLGLDERKLFFSQRRLSEYERAYRRYLHAYCLLGFVGEHSLDEIAKGVPDYDEELHQSDVKKLVVIARKIGECCYYGGRLGEGMAWCEKAIALAGQRLRLVLYPVFGVMAKIYIEMKEFELAQEAIDVGYYLKRYDSLLSRCQALLDKAKDGKELDDGPTELVRYEFGFSYTENAKWTKDFPDCIESRVVQRRECMLTFPFGEPEREISFVVSVTTVAALEVSLREQLGSESGLKKVRVEKGGPRLDPIDLPLRRLTVFLNGKEYRVKDCSRS